MICLFRNCSRCTADEKYCVSQIYICAAVRLKRRCSQLHTAAQHRNSARTLISSLMLAALFILKRGKLTFFPSLCRVCYHVWGKNLYPPPHLRRPYFRAISNCDLTIKIAVLSAESPYFQDFALYVDIKCPEGRILQGLILFSMLSNRFCRKEDKGCYSETFPAYAPVRVPQGTLLPYQLKGAALIIGRAMFSELTKNNI